MSFGKDVEKWAESAGESLQDVIEGTALSMYTSVIKRSPIDKGTFRGNWRINAGYIDDIVDDSTQPEMNPNLSAKVGESIYISNSLPYAVALEEGHSKQAPLGIVAVTVADFNRAAEVAAIKAGWKD